jgi:hypothetical protein
MVLHASFTASTSIMLMPTDSAPIARIKLIFTHDRAASRDWFIASLVARAKLIITAETCNGH